MLLLLLATTEPALAQPRDAARVQQGEDIVAWREVDASDDRQLRAFADEFPSSRLADRALAQLDELPEGAEPTEAQPVQTLRIGEQQDMGQIEQRSESRLDPMVELGWTGGQHTAGMYLYTGVTGDHLGVAVRGTAGTDGLDLGFALRGTLSQDHLSPYAELLAEARQPALGVALGVAQPLRRGFSLSLAVETMVLGQELEPAVRFGAGKAF
jgi:hypothetical protein